MSRRWPEKMEDWTDRDGNRHRDLRFGRKFVVGAKIPIFGDTDSAPVGKVPIHTQTLVTQSGIRIIMHFRDAIKTEDLEKIFCGGKYENPADWFHLQNWIGRVPATGDEFLAVQNVKKYHSLDDIGRIRMMDTLQVEDQEILKKSIVRYARVTKTRVFNSQDPRLMYKTEDGKTPFSWYGGGKAVSTSVAKRAKFRLDNNLTTPADSREAATTSGRATRSRTRQTDLEDVASKEFKKLARTASAEKVNQDLLLIKTTGSVLEIPEDNLLEAMGKYINDYLNDIHSVAKYEQDRFSQEALQTFFDRVKGKNSTIHI